MNFKIIDPLIGAGSGAAIATLVYFILPGDWNMIPGMIAGGLSGMGISFLLTLILMPFFGAFEVMIPLHIVGMLTGMMVGMVSTLESTPIFCLTTLGGLTGLTVAIIIYFSNKRHKKRVYNYSKVNQAI
jgi:hypothetical protein